MPALHVWFQHCSLFVCNSAHILHYNSIACSSYACLAVWWWSNDAWWSFCVGHRCADIIDFVRSARFILSFYCVSQWCISKAYSAERESRDALFVFSILRDHLWARPRKRERERDYSDKILIVYFFQHHFFVVGILCNVNSSCFSEILRALSNTLRTGSSIKWPVIFRHPETYNNESTD